MSNRTQAEADAAEQAAFARGDAEETQRAIAELTAAVAALTAEVRELRARPSATEAMSPEAISREHAAEQQMCAALLEAGWYRMGVAPAHWYPPMAAGTAPPRCLSCAYSVMMAERGEK